MANFDLHKAMKCVDDFRLNLGKKSFVPIVIGGMGVDISTARLALTAARMGGIGHISDAMVTTVSDRYFNTRFTKNKIAANRQFLQSADKSQVHFDLKELRDATRLYVEDTMNQKKGDGLVFINCMEKLTMNAPRESLEVRLKSALDAGIDGITLAAGLHLGSFALIADHPRFRDAFLGIIVSSRRALELFLKKNQKFNRLPDYIVVEGPLAGGHLGFAVENWQEFKLQNIVQEVGLFLKTQNLNIPIIAAGGVFTGSDAVEMLELGASAVQVATRFTVTQECGLPSEAKQAYFAAQKDDIEVNMASPTGYPMRMLKSSPGLAKHNKPNCEPYGFLLDAKGQCAYLADFYAGKKSEKTCLCTHMRNFDIWTCGQNTYRLKETSIQNADGTYQELSAEHVFKDYQFSKDHQILLPKKEENPR